MNRLRISFRVAAVLHSLAEGIREIPSAFFLVANHVRSNCRLTPSRPTHFSTCLWIKMTSFVQDNSDWACTLHL
jgi:hypothetical protein